jgi:signal transduction histidine kinase
MILFAGLFILIAVLFVVICHLSRKQHLANIQSIKDDYREILSQESSNLRERTRTLEREAFAAFDEADLPLDLCRTNRLFVRSEGKFLPAGIADVPPKGNVSPDVARRSLSLGLGLKLSGEAGRAREQIETASRISVKTAEDLDVRISALVELLKISEYRNPGILFSIFHALFHYAGLKPSDAQARDVEDTLRNSIPRYEEFKGQDVEMWKTAMEISQASSNRPPPFRIVCNGQILSVNAKGQACLLSLEAFSRDSSNAIIRITATAPGEKAVVARQMHFPPVYAWISAKEFEARKRSIEHAYFLTKVMLGILLAIIAGMGFGIGVIVKRQHEIAALKSSFVSTVSHELRTPMALIRLYAESLAVDKPPAGAKERYTRAIMAETDRLTALVNNVLDFSRLERGTLALNVRETDVSKVCNEVLDSFSFRLEKEEIILARRIDPGLKALVDPLALTQVIFNLVDNAIKYSGGKHAIEVEMKAAGDKICLRVKDNGIGIPGSLKQRIFMPFVRGEDSRVTAQRGSGIGLSIVSQLLERMQCSISFFANVPEGTVFEVMLKK